MVSKSKAVSAIINKRERLQGTYREGKSKEIKNRKIKRKNKKGEITAMEVPQMDKELWWIIHCTWASFSLNILALRSRQMDQMIASVKVLLSSSPCNSTRATSLAE